MIASELFQPASLGWDERVAVVVGGFWASAMVWYEPTETFVATPILLTCTGVLLLSVLVPLPSSPNWLKPHSQTVPSLFSAAVFKALFEMSVTPLRPLTCPGVLLSM